MTAPELHSAQDRFVQDGFSRLRAQVESEIRPQVVAKYTERLATAGPWQRFWLCRKIDREVRSRVNMSIPPAALS